MTPPASGEKACKQRGKGIPTRGRKAVVEPDRAALGKFIRLPDKITQGANSGAHRPGTVGRLAGQSRISALPEAGRGWGRTQQMTASS